MRIIADFHVHSKYARATSPRCDIKGLAEGAKYKGITLMGTGDFTHPKYFDEIKSELNSELIAYGINFMLTSEISTIWRDDEDKLKRMHHLLLAPSLDVAMQINDSLGTFGALGSDGRPQLKMSAVEFADKIFSVSSDIAIIPAHIWTPHFSLFGSVGGVNRIEDAFGERTDKIFALETGLSSNPAMNWMIDSLDRFTLVSNSDAHSLEKLGREANVFELPELSYKSIVDALKTRKGFVKTYEFYPEEGKYHYDGHRNCGVVLSPSEAKERKNICPVCKKKLTVGVLHRVFELAENAKVKRKSNFRPIEAVPFQSIVPLQTIISKALKKSEISIAVKEEHDRLVRYFGNEFAVFEASEEKIRLATNSEIAQAIIDVKNGNVEWLPGYDGVFGKLVLGKAKAVNRILPLL